MCIMSLCHSMKESFENLDEDAAAHSCPCLTSCYWPAAISWSIVDERASVNWNQTANRIMTNRSSKRSVHLSSIQWVASQKSRCRHSGRRGIAVRERCVVAYGKQSSDARTDECELPAAIYLDGVCHIQPPERIQASGALRQLCDYTGQAILCVRPAVDCERRGGEICSRALILSPRLHPGTAGQSACDQERYWCSDSQPSDQSQSIRDDCCFGKSRRRLSK
ncbi:uncharacterized protein V6R79_006293 [Siganus canaliculatus]